MKQYRAPNPGWLWVASPTLDSRDSHHQNSDGTAAFSSVTQAFTFRAEPIDDIDGWTESP